MCCAKCGKMVGFSLLVIGVVFVLQNLGRWNVWGLDLWTVLVLLAGMSMLAMGCCPDCKSCCGGSCETKAPKKK